ETGAGVWRSERASFAARTRARGARIESHRPAVYGRWFGRFSLSGALRDGIFLATERSQPRRRNDATRRLHHRGGPLRASGEQTIAGRDRQLRPFSRSRTRGAEKRE